MSNYLSQKALERKIIQKRGNWEHGMYKKPQAIQGKQCKNSFKKIKLEAKI